MKKQIWLLPEDVELVRGAILLVIAGLEDGSALQNRCEKFATQYVKRRLANVVKLFPSDGGMFTTSTASEMTTGGGHPARP